MRTISIDSVSDAPEHVQVHKYIQYVGHEIISKIRISECASAAVSVLATVFTLLAPRFQCVNWVKQNRGNELTSCAS